MSFKDLDIQCSYISYGDKNIAKALVVPALKQSVSYKRSVGYFSSNVIETILEGIQGIVKNNGVIQLITSPKLSAEDINAISLGYEKREELIKRSFFNMFDEEIAYFEDDTLEIIVDLIAKGYLDIKIVVTNGVGDYHDKLAIFEDEEGNKIVFYGSANETLNGYRNNYEKIRISRSWRENDIEHVIDEVEEFDRIWNNENDYVKVHEFKESMINHILQIIEHKRSVKKSTGIVLRDYQEKAISEWRNNGYRGFYIMATGTGKTWTAIYSALELMKQKEIMLVICAPYKHLVLQWAEDVKKAMPDATIIMVSSENSKWEKEINEEIILQKHNNGNKVVIISTITSFKLARFKKILDRCRQEAMLIVDEAHRFKLREQWIKDKYKYMLGLSATPVSGKNVESGRELVDFFGGIVFNLPIEKVLGKYLVNYNYLPIIVTPTEEEEIRFRQLTKQMIACFKNEILQDVERYVKLRRSRLRIISMAQEKIDKISDIIDYVEESDHVIVYCGDGRLFDSAGEEIRHIQYVKGVLHEKGHRPSQFTASENMDERESRVEGFNSGDITSLVAIRCLDEGINIPSIKGAVILSSNDDAREFIQRRGRILRKYKNKEFANIYDVLVLPSSSLEGMAKIELRRFKEYSRLALNRDELQTQLQEYLKYYNIDEDSIKIEEIECEEDYDD